MIGGSFRRDRMPTVSLPMPVRIAVLLIIGTVLSVGLPSLRPPAGLAQSMPEADAPDPEAVTRGAYIFDAAGCVGCHTDVRNGGLPLAGGRALETPFGTFYSPNITPDPEFGIGGWSDDDFQRALREGISPEGHAYFPSFPYTSYTGMSERDILDLKAYLFALEPVAQDNRPHDLRAPFGWRFLLPVWQFLYLEEGPLGVAEEAQGGDPRQRGRYLVEALGHCGECHTSRNWLGALDRERHLAGNPDGPEGDPVPNITPSDPKGIGTWSESDIVFFLEIGMTPEGDFVGGGMNEVVENSTAKLTAEDREAIAAYLKSLPPIPAESGH